MAQATICMAEVFGGPQDGVHVPVEDHPPCLYFRRWPADLDPITAIPVSISPPRFYARYELAGGIKKPNITLLHYLFDDYAP